MGRKGGRHCARAREKVCDNGKFVTYLGGEYRRHTVHKMEGGEEEEEEAKGIQGEYKRHKLHKVFSIECVLDRHKLDKVGNAQRERMMTSKGI